MLLFHRIKIERLKELDDINLYIENVVENLFYDTSKSLKIAISDFELINYDEILKRFENFLKRRNSNILKVLGLNSKESLEELSEFSKGIYDKKRYFSTNGIFSDREIEELYRLYSVPKVIVEYINEEKNKETKEKIMFFYLFINN